MAISGKNKIPKILHLYWGKDIALSWLRWMTVYSFSKLNPKWRIIIWYPDKPGENASWKTKEHNYAIYKGKDWFDELTIISNNVSIEKANIDDFPPLTNVHRSDLFRWRLLHTIGGFWSDFDILYFRKMSCLDIDYTKDSLLCWGEITELKDWQAIGFLAGATGSYLFKKMEIRGLELAKSPNLTYQALGSDLLRSFAVPGCFSVDGSKIGQIPQTSVYPFHSVNSQKAGIWEDYKLLDIQKNTIGIHWFAAQQKPSIIEAKLSGEKDVLLKYNTSGIAFALNNLNKKHVMNIEQKKHKKQKNGYVKYSIIMPYADRATLLHNTLVSYYHWYSGRKDLEIVLVQDSKCKEISELNLVIDKWRADGLLINHLEYEADELCNPTPLINYGAKNAKGEYIILTSPEIYHHSNILDGLDDFFLINPNKYAVCACLSRQEPSVINNRLPISKFDEIHGRYGKWFQHGVYRPVMYHFCSSISKELWDKLDGFDNDFSDGYCFDDDAFREKVKKHKIEIVPLDNLLTFHQYHKSVERPEDKMIRWKKNKALYEYKYGKYIHIPPSDFTGEL